MASLVDRCRLCLGEHDCIHVLSYLDGKTKLLSVLNVIAGVQYPETEPLPKNLCESCFDQTRQVYLFQQNCLKSLEQILQKRTPIKEASQLVTTIQASTTQQQPSLPLPLEVKPAQTDYVVEPIIFSEIEDSEEGEEEEEQQPQEHEEECHMGDVKVEDAKDVIVEDAEEKIKVDSEDLDEAQVAEYDTEVDLIEFIGDGIEEKPGDTRKLSGTKRTPSKRTFECSWCDKSFKSSKKLAEHNRCTHERETESSVKFYMCPKCLVKFEFDDYNRHQETECADADAMLKPFSCNICLERFTYQMDARRHQAEKHDSQKRYSCPECHMRFTRSSQVTLHMRGHTNEKPFECEVCQVRFSKKTNMVRHMKVHEAENAFVCPICSKSFKWETSLKVHINSHTQARRYKCENCCKEYGSLSGYRKHIITAHS